MSGSSLKPDADVGPILDALAADEEAEATYQLLALMQEEDEGQRIEMSGALD